MARQGGRVQLEQSDMRLALNMAKMVKRGFSHAPIEETQYLIKKPRAEVWEEKKWSVEFPGHKKVKAAMERHPAMLRQNQTPGIHLYHKGTAKNLHTLCRRNRTGAPLPNRRRKATPEPTPDPIPSLLGTSPASPGNTSGSQHLEIINLLTGYVYSHTSLPCAESFTLNRSAQDSEHDTDYYPDMLPDEGTSTG